MTHEIKKGDLAMNYPQHFKAHSYARKQKQILLLTRQERY